MQLSRGCKDDRSPILATMKDADSFLPALTKSLSELNAEPEMPTAQFCHAMSLILPVFDHLGAPLQAPHLHQPRPNDVSSSLHGAITCARGRALPLLP